MFLCLPSSSSLSASYSLWYLCDFLPLVFGAVSGISCDPFEDESGDHAKEETLPFFSLSSQDSPSDGESSIFTSSLSFLGEVVGMLQPAKVSCRSDLPSSVVT